METVQARWERIRKNQVTLRDLIVRLDRGVQDELEKHYPFQRKWKIIEKQ